MSILVRSARRVKPSRRSPAPLTPFGFGIETFEPSSMIRPTPVKGDPKALVHITTNENWHEETDPARFFPFLVTLTRDGREVDAQGCDTLGQAEALVAHWSQPLPVNILKPTEEERALFQGPLGPLDQILQPEEMVSAPCCDDSEPAPCSACVNGVSTDDTPSTEDLEAKHRELMPEYFDAREVDEAREQERWEQKCAIPSFKTTDDFGEVDFTAGAEWTLEKVIEMLLARIARNPDMFTAEWVVWDGNNVMAVIGQRNDGKPFVTMLDETDEDDDDEDAGDPLSWPAWTDEAFWEPNGDAPEPVAEEATLSLAGLIESEAAVLRARGLAAYELMADHLVELARIVRTVDATHPNQVWARVDVLDRDFTEAAVAWEMREEPELNSAGVPV